MRYLIPILMLVAAAVVARDPALPDDALTDGDKERLLEYLRTAHGTASPDRKKIVLTRKSTSEIKQADASGKARTIQVEVRKKRTFIKRDDGSDTAVVEAPEPPVQEAQPARIAMTAPVTMEPKAGAMVMRFVLPSEFTAATAPRPVEGWRRPGRTSGSGRGFGCSARRRRRCCSRRAGRRRRWPGSTRCRV